MSPNHQGVRTPLLTSAAVAQWLESATDNRVVAGSNSTGTAWKLAISFFPLCQCLSEETISRWSLLSGVYVRGSKISHTGSGVDSVIYLVNNVDTTLITNCVKVSASIFRQLWWSSATFCRSLVMSTVLLLLFPFLWCRTLQDLFTEANWSDHMVRDLRNDRTCIFLHTFALVIWYLYNTWKWRQ